MPDAVTDILIKEGDYKRREKNIRENLADELQGVLTDVEAEHLRQGGLNPLIACSIASLRLYMRARR